MAMTTQTELLREALQAASNYIDALGGDSRSYRQALTQPEQPAPQGCEQYSAYDPDVGVAEIFQEQLAPQGRQLAKHQPCGCVLCTCEDEEQCHGCGAHHCGTHPLAEFPNPLYASPTPPQAERAHGITGKGNAS